MTDLFSPMLSKPLRLLIADDELLARQRLLRYVRQLEAPWEVAEAADGLEAVAQLHEFAPDVVLLDIEMPGLNGFEVLQQFEARPFHVIFQTAYDQFALRAFEEHACDYLLKPVRPERLQKALALALQRVQTEARLVALEQTLTQRHGALRRLSVKQGRRWRLLDVSEIHCFVSQAHHTLAYFGEQHEAIVELSLTKLRERLDPTEFCSLHRANLVRVAALRALLVKRDGEMQIELMNGMQLPVSRSHRAQARSLVKQPVAE